VVVVYTVEDIMSSPVVSIRSSATVGEAAKLMAKHNIGALLVLIKGDSMRVEDLGIVTERDILVKVVAADMRADMPVSKVMNKPLISVETGESIDEAMSLMNEHGIRRMPVSREGEVVGIVTSYDLSKNLHFSVARDLLKHRRRHHHD
jgi:CBS domain-containing protein